MQWSHSGIDLHPTPDPATGNTALAQAMCGAVVDVAAMVVALPPPAAAAGPGGGGGLPPHPAVEQQAAAAAADHQQQLLLPYPASLRHNDCHYVYQASWGGHCAEAACLRRCTGLACPPCWHLALTVPCVPFPPRRPCATCPTSLRRACSSWCTATSTL